MHIYINGKPVNNPLIKAAFILIMALVMIAFIAFIVLFLLPFIGIVLAFSLYLFIGLILIAFCMILFTPKFHIRHVNKNASNPDKHIKIIEIKTFDQQDNDKS